MDLAGAGAVDKRIPTGLPQEHVVPAPERSDGTDPRSASDVAETEHVTGASDGLDAAERVRPQRRGHARDFRWAERAVGDMGVADTVDGHADRGRRRGTSDHD